MKYIKPCYSTPITSYEVRASINLDPWILEETSQLIKCKKDITCYFGYHACSHACRWNLAWIAPLVCSEVVEWNLHVVCHIYLLPVGKIKSVQTYYVSVRSKSNLAIGFEQNQIVDSMYVYLSKSNKLFISFKTIVTCIRVTYILKM